MNDTSKNNSKLLKYRSSSEYSLDDNILMSEKGEMKCLVCGQLLIELSPLRSKSCIRLGVLSFEKSTNVIEILISDETNIDSLIGKQVCFTGKLRYSLFNPNSLIKGKGPN